VPTRASCAVQCAAIVSAAAAGDDPASVKPPYVEVGDCWSYRASRLFHHGWIREYRECVTHIDRSKNLVLALATVKEDGREIETSYSLEWAESTPIDGRYNEPPASFLRFPLNVGDKYKVAFGAVNTQGFGSNVRQVTYDMEVIGWEEVAVPAGKFRALRIDGRASIPLQLSPASPPDNFEVELTKYELNK